MIYGNLTNVLHSNRKTVISRCSKSILCFTLIYFISSTAQAQSFFIEDHEKTIVLNGVSTNQVNKEQTYYLLPHALYHKKSKTAERYISQGTTLFYFNKNGVIDIDVSSPRSEITLAQNGALNIQWDTLIGENSITYSISKEPFNGIYGELVVGYLANGLLPYNKEEQMLLPYTQKNDFTRLIPSNTEKEIFRFDEQAILFGNEHLKITKNGHLNVLTVRGLSTSRLNLLADTYDEAVDAWSTQFDLLPPENFNILLDNRADATTPFIKNAIILHAGISNTELIYQMLNTLGKSMLLTTNPIISESDLEATTLALILNLYDRSKSEKVKSALFPKLYSLQRNYNDGLTPMFGDPLMDREKRLLSAMAKLLSKTHDFESRSNFIEANILHEVYSDDLKTNRPSKVNIVSDYSGRFLWKYLRRSIAPDYKKPVAIPLIGFNKYDGLMIGAGLRYRGNLDFDFIPMYGMKSNKIVGLGSLSKKIYPDNPVYFRMVKPYIQLQKFSFDENISNDNTLDYWRTTIGTNFHLLSERNKFSSFAEYFNIAFSHIREDAFTLLTPSQKTNPFNIFRFSYHVEDKRTISPRSFFARLENGHYENINGKQSYIKLEGAYEGSFAYHSGKYVTIRIYGGVFPHNTQDNSASVNNFFTRGSLSLFNRGFSDYAYDHLLMNRGNFGLFSQQIFKGNGGFKIPATDFFGYGQSNKMLFSTNLTFDLPFTQRYIPVKSYLDLAYVKDNTPIGPTGNDEFYASGGIAIDWKNKFSVFFPLFHTKQLKYIVYEGDIQGQTFRNYLKRISFVIDLSNMINLNK